MLPAPFVLFWAAGQFKARQGSLLDRHPLVIFSVVGTRQLLQDDVSAMPTGFLFPGPLACAVVGGGGLTWRSVSSARGAT